jgi:hypothetical protein
LEIGEFKSSKIREEREGLNGDTRKILWLQISGHTWEADRPRRTGEINDLECRGQIAECPVEIGFEGILHTYRNLLKRGRILGEQCLESQEGGFRQSERYRFQGLSGRRASDSHDIRIDVVENDILDPFEASMLQSHHDGSNRNRTTAKA